MRRTRGELLEFFNNHKNPFNISYSCFYGRVKIGKSFEEAMNKPSNRINLVNKYKELNNPNNISYQTFVHRVKSGMTPEEAISKKKSNNTGLIKKYRELENPYNISYQTFYLRVKNGINPEEAMKIPNKRNIFPRGDLFVEYNGKYLKIKDAKPLLSLEQCKKLYKSGIKLEKLFKNLE